VKEVSPEGFSRLRHDLRTPINHILGYSELLAEDATEAKNEGMVRDLMRIREAARHLLEIVQERLVPGLESGLGSSVKPGTVSEGEDWGGVSDGLSGNVLVVDDDEGNRELLERHLKRLGLGVSSVASGEEALRRVMEPGLDVVLLDVMMPGLDGTGVLERMKADPATRHLPVIMVSGWDQLDGVARCISMGAEDFLSKPFNPVLLRARIGASLEKKALRDAEQRYLETIERTRRRLEGELEQARQYVASTFPAKVQGKVGLDWLHEPSSELGGDALGYHWIDEDHLAIYLLDVCGHGVGASLMAVAAINVLRTGGLGSVDFRDPGAVLSALNEAFPMSRHNDMYFTIWYGVYHAREGWLEHASGGHPPALLLKPVDGHGGWEAVRLRVAGPIIGAVEGRRYRSAREVVPRGARLFVMSDGCYEVRSEDGTVYGYDDFERFVRERGGVDQVLGEVLAWARQSRGSDLLEDDFSMVRCCFEG